MNFCFGRFHFLQKSLCLYQKLVTKHSNCLQQTFIKTKNSMFHSFMQQSHKRTDKLKCPQHSIIKLVLLITLLSFVSCHSQCVHDEMIEQTQKHYFNDLHQARLLQTSNVGPIRIFADYSQVTTGGVQQKNLVKRIVNITALYFSRTLKVNRLTRLQFPSNVSRTCNTLTVPQIYVTQGVVGDLGIIVGNQNNPTAVYTAKSAACAFLQSNKRSIWGVMIFNNAFLKFDQYGFQQVLFVGIHQATHILGFSAQMYTTFPTGSLLRNQTKGDYTDYYLDSPAIRREILNHFNCSTNGLLLQDQDGTLIGSHIQRKIVGNEFMIASGKKHSFISRFSLAVLQSTGWYPEVNYSMAEPTTWGKSKGCSIFNVDDCNSDEFCQGSSFGCEWDMTSIGKCQPDAFTGACLTFKYYTNTICIDQNFQLKNLNAALNAIERGGDSSRCFSSNFRAIAKTANSLNYRCYVSVCSTNGRYIYILIGSMVLVCRVPGQILMAPAGLEGTLTCPMNFNNMCQNKKTCAYHCNKNGACINGMCLCTGQKQLSASCLDAALTVDQVGTTGGFVIDQNGNGTEYYSKVDDTVMLIDNKCIAGYVYDQTFGECMKCSEMFGCANCNEKGCV